MQFIRKGEDMEEKKDYTEYNKEVVSTLTIIKRVLYSLIFLVLLVSVSFNMYLAFQNRRLNTALDFYTGRMQQMVMRYQAEQDLFRDLLAYAQDKPELKKLLKRYNITPERFSGGPNTKQ